MQNTSDFGKIHTHIGGRKETFSRFLIFEGNFKVSIGIRGNSTLTGKISAHSLLLDHRGLIPILYGLVVLFCLII